MNFRRTDLSVLVIAFWVVCLPEPTRLSAQDERPQVISEEVSPALTEVAVVEESKKGKDAKKKPEKKDDGWISLMPKKGLDGWEITDFGENGKVNRDGEQLIIEMGDPLNGITYKKKDFPTDNFEIYLEANRLDGSDFLVGLTFPVKKEFCSFIAGGWGGGLVGLSSVDGFDASENSTSTFTDFENKKWYKFKLRVEPEYIRAWIDGEEYFRQEREDHEFSTRIEVYASQPLGLCAFQSKVAVRNFKWRPIGKDAKSKSKEDAKDNQDSAKTAEPIKELQTQELGEDK